MKHNYLTLLLAVLMSIASNVVSAHDFAVDDIYYDITSSTNLTVEVTYRGSSYNSYSNEYTGKVTIPETVTYNSKTYRVTSIGDCAFYGCIGLTSVTIPNNVTRIDAYAFYDCSRLYRVTIPNSVTRIGINAFCNCIGLSRAEFASVENLCGITFGNIDANPLYNTHQLYIDDKEITDLVIPNSVTEIGKYAFYGCSDLTSVTIPNSVTKIGNDAFYGCNSLTKAEFASVECLWGITFGNDYANPLYYAQHLYVNGEEVTDLVIPSSVTSIDNLSSSFFSGLTSIVVENGNLIYDSREGCNAIINTATKTLLHGCKNTTIPNSVTSIGERAFRDCSGLTFINIPNSVTSIGERAFRDCI